MTGRACHVLTSFHHLGHFIANPVVKQDEIAVNFFPMEMPDGVRGSYSANLTPALFGFPYTSPTPETAARGVGAVPAPFVWRKNNKQYGLSFPAFGKK